MGESTSTAKDLLSVKSRKSSRRFISITVQNSPYKSFCRCRAFFYVIVHVLWVFTPRMSLTKRSRQRFNWPAVQLQCSLICYFAPSPSWGRGPGKGGRRGLLPQNLGGVWRPLNKTCTIIMIKICDFLYPISDQNS